MATFFIEQFGCRATQADAAAIERQLRDRGYSARRRKCAHGADVVVVNTCTVTAAADLQARQAIHAIHRHNFPRRPNRCHRMRYAQRATLKSLPLLAESHGWWEIRISRRFRALFRK